MRKEQLIAIVLGSIIGVGVAFALWKLPRQNNSIAKNTTQDSAQNSHVSENSHSDFSIVTPSQNAVAREENVEIKGFSPTGATVVSVANEVSLTKSTSTGEFSVDTTLSSGINTIELWLFEKDKEPKSILTTLIYSSQLGDDEPSRETLAIIGAITDIASDTLQVRTEEGDIEQLSISSETTYGSTINSPKDIEFSDLAIGDLVAALGSKNGDDVMEVARVIVTTQKKPEQLTIAAGTIKTLTNKDFIVQKNISGEEVSIDAKNSPKTYSTKEDEVVSARLLNAQEGDQIVVIGDMEDDELIASTIILL